MTSADALLTRFRASWPPDDWGRLTIVVAVSGGADSVALLRLLVACRRQAADRLIVAHFDHATRSLDSSRDARFVQRVAAELGLDSRCQRFAGASSLDNESSAREARYAFLRAVAGEVGARYLATGHTADDQAETILHHIIRGTGLAGLRGIPATRTINESLTIKRPLLGFRRDELRSYLDTIGQPYCEDRTNTDLRYTRNRIRHQLIPFIHAQFDRDIGPSLVRLGTTADEIQRDIRERVAPVVDCVVVSTVNDTLTIDRRPLRRHSSLLVRETLITIWRDLNWPLQSVTDCALEITGCRVCERASVQPDISG